MSLLEDGTCFHPESSSLSLTRPFPARIALISQIVKGERADQALRYTMGPVSLPRYCLPMGGGCSRHTPAAVSGHGGAPTVPDQIFASPQVIPGSNVLVDPQDAMERVRLGEEDVMERRLRREDRKLEELRRILTDRQRALAEGKKKKTVDDVLWDGINVHVTPADLAPKSAKQRKWEEYLWREWDRDNERFPRGSLDGMLRATREVAAARRADPEAADRAEQAEIGEVDGGKRAMYWERDDSLHYHDLGPDGKPITEEEMLQAQKASEPAGSSSRGRGAAIRAGAKKPGPGRGVPRRKRGGFDPMCQFCGGGTGGQEKDEVTEQGAEIHGQKIFTRDDWEAVKRGKDFETTFPDSDDLRTLDWLGGEKEKPYTKEEDSMSAQGIHLLLPKDWADFSKAKGTYTHYGIGPLP